MGHPAEGGSRGRRGESAANGIRYNDGMTQKTSELLQEALTLSEEERADLACSLIDSLDATIDEGAERAWDEEIARRAADLDSGKAKTVPWEKVQTQISSRLADGKQKS